MAAGWTREAHRALIESERIQQTAEVLLDARASAKGLAGLDAALQPASLNEAYAVQDAMAARMGPIGGWKIGAASPDATPMFGPMPLRNGFVKTGGEMQGPRRLRGVEAEIGFLLRRDLPARTMRYSREEILGAIGSVHPVIEVLESAFVAPDEAEHLAMVADLQMNGGFVHGPAHHGPAHHGPAHQEWQAIDITQERLEVIIDGVVRWSGVGRNTNGPDLMRLVDFLVNEAQWRTGGLEVGQWITTGSWMGKLLAMERSSVEVRFEHFGVAACRFAS